MPPFGAQPWPLIDRTLPAARIDERVTFAAEAVEILFEDAADQHRRDAGIEGVAALREDLERGGSGQRMARGDGGGAADHRRPRRTLRARHRRHHDNREQPRHPPAAPR